MPDPLVRGEDRLPRTEWPPSGLDCAPSMARPFSLRVGRAFPVDVPVARHRTETRQTPRSDDTSKDGTVVTDTWTTPDD